MIPEAGSGATGARVSDYEYELSPDRIARYPADRRDESRLLVVDRGSNALRHLRFRDLLSLVEPGDLLVLNESRVLPVRLLGKKPTGAPGEILLLRPLPAGVPGGGEADGPAGQAVNGRKGAGGQPEASGQRRFSGHPEVSGHPEAREMATGDRDPRTDLWEALVRPGGKLKPGRTVEIAPELSVEILDGTPEGGRIVRLHTELPPLEAIHRFGHVPLPPYIDRQDEEVDRHRYQTVYARIPGSVAAPTAGLHFTDELLDALALSGVSLGRVTLHVGVGTFRPVEVQDPAEHTMHREEYRIPFKTAEAVHACKAAGGKVWAVGTTVVRTLESAVGEDGRLRPGPGETRLFIRPPFTFRVVDRLITNFHLPRSTLLMLVSAFAGHHRIMRAYQAAIAGEYRFYSYGDAMAIL